MKTFKRRAASLVLALCLLAAALPGARADGAETAISSVEDLLAFAKQCSLDAWSQGKTVRLTADLDLTEADFTPIPTFGGTFLGEGHKITNLHITAAGSNMGLFRYLQEGAVVQDLFVSGPPAAPSMWAASWEITPGPCGTAASTAPWRARPPWAAWRG